MQFIDEAKISIRSGKGGQGCVSFRREAFVPHGGPNGGDGGTGGDVIIECIDSENTLIDFRYRQHFKAQSGENGQGSNKFGVGGENLIIKVPKGTQIFAEDGETLVADMTEKGQRIILAKGGGGGAGNARFKSSTNQAPRYAGKGEEGTEYWLWLKLKILSDVGLVGLPNAGKSTLLSVLSRAKPKIADYPFTTLIPQLGVVYVNYGEFVIADLPGLIEGASQGVGLGHRFLKHVERCQVLLHLLDGSLSYQEIFKNYHTVKKELQKYSKLLNDKQTIIALNKTELVLEDDLKQKIESLKNRINQEVFVISCYKKTGLHHLKEHLYKIISNPEGKLGVKKFR